MVYYNHKERKVRDTTKHREFNNIATIILTLALIVMAITIAMLIGITKENVKVTTAEPVTAQSNIDTSALDNWDGCYSDGAIRMIGAWYYSTLDDGSMLIEDETGELWNMETTVDEQDFLLLWIADNNTQDNVHDDIVLKVWVEAYN